MKFLVPFALGLLHAVSALPSRQLFPRAACNGNTDTTRRQWCDKDIDYDYVHQPAPSTGRVREYFFEISNATLTAATAPDGVPRYAVLINGQMPGPLIEADWGDTVRVHLTNNLQDQQGTGLHFHGIVQRGSFESDGVPSITQCPLAPGESMTYTWKAEQYGSSWYHSHYSLQAWDGAFGPIIIHGPASEDYQEDLGALFLNDWDHRSCHEQQLIADRGAPPPQANGLINGTNVFTSGTTTTGKRFETVFEPGKSYRIRIVNAAIDSFFSFGIDGHSFKVIASDFTPIVPYETDSLSITMGQRYDIIVKAKNQTSGNYWIRAVPQSCSSHTNPMNIKGILRYDSTSTADPTTSGISTRTACQDEPINKLVPVVNTPVGPAQKTHDLPLGLTRDVNGRFIWTMNSTNMLVDLKNPSIMRAAANNFTFAKQEAVINVEGGANDWTYLVINSAGGGPSHPIHLHGHDFSVLAQGTVPYTSDVELKLNNAPRRDTATLTQPGYLVMAFPADNPGIWLMHCHIGYHTLQGFGLQIVERKSEIRSLINTNDVTNTCNKWKQWTIDNNWTQPDNDSGI
ncbi:multicopper oxidase [Patellaria atrata CBS 101060]|uniref:Multicopper oxidase n=1 Tax=Patellaria atrata CBS 101060 TaxID=1346257 RepID=A0A9P4SIQ3_9PEZI|nr:multicopper oxidase [Patellaria atrata CBS 101060]